ncbi:MAG: SDR family oxidoreductase [Actinomycetia bacterium]|jgi:NAD(P)-dependent dehydrogenase (short-subunit alcohol dehydrogenase family)|nr:SDR family oxidoreductase [Actinomycetes bacterium]
MGKVAIVTGGAAGIGLALGTAMFRRGDVVVLADIDGAGAEREATRLTGKGPGVAQAAHLDVRDAAAVADLVHRTADEHGRLDIMVNNAGIGVGGELQELTVAHWDRVIDVNLRGVVHGVMAAYPLMIAQRSGHIVNTASLAGLVPFGLLTPYVTTKHAVVGLSLALRQEAAPKGVRVTVACPGFTDTAILDKGGPEDLPQARLAGHVRMLAERQTGGLYDVERLARDILRGVDRNEAMVVAPASARATWRLQRLSPPVVGRVAARQIAWARRLTETRPDEPGS